MAGTKNQFACNAWGDTDPGRVRGNNEDRLYCDPERGIFIVVDGMGGETAGEVAAQKALEFVEKRLRQETGTAARRLREAIAGANNEIYRLARIHPEWHGMACVLTAAVLEDGTLHVGHVGDSRLYLVRDGRMSKITSDHSPVGNREDAGELTELEAMRHPRRNEVFRDIGSRTHSPDDEDFIEYARVTFDPGAAALICSDGLSDMLTSSEILAEVLRNAGRPRETVRELIAKANEAGGKDNVSVIVIEGEDFSRGGSGNGTAGVLRRAEDATALAAAARRVVGGRWAFFAYGLIAGALLLGAWLKYRGGSPEDAPPPAPPGPKVLVVERSSPEFPSITKALAAARPGDRIEVTDGEYQESIRLKTGVDVAARTPGKAVLRFTRAMPGADAAIVAEGAFDAAVSGLAVNADLAAALPFGIRISNSDVELSNLDISGAVQAGILINGNSRGGLAASYIHGCLGPGIAVAGSAAPALLGNVIHENGISREHAAPGMYVTEDANPTVVRNVFSNNGAEAIRVQRPELRDRMLDNLFVGPGRPDRRVAIERARK